MARFDVYRNSAGEGFLLEVQADLLSHLNTRVVVPLLPSDGEFQPARGLNPVFEIEGGRFLMATQFLATYRAACSRRRWRDWALSGPKLR